MTIPSNDISTLLSLAFEIEGLLMLAERRDEMTPVEALNLLSDKCAALLDGVNRLKPGTEPSVIPDTSDKSETSDNSDRSDKSESSEIAAAATFEEIEDAEPEPAPSDISVKSETPKPEEPARASKAAEQARAARPISLTLNDRFRFRRTLFGGSDAQMNETLAILADLPDAADRDDFLVNDLCWKLDDPEVIDFIAIIDARR